MQKYTEVDRCRSCFGDSLKEVLDLNAQPLANNYHHGEEQEQFPLKINMCRSCFHAQLSVVVNPDLMFKNYLYVSGTSKTLNDYFDYFVDLCEEYTSSKGRVLDIACNDGTQLDKFKEKGWKTHGIDPAENLFKLSNKNHNVICDYWSVPVAVAYKDKFDVITAQNVFAHVADIHSFLKASHLALNDNGHLFIQTSQADMILDSQFDTIYHEHLSFFNTKSMKTCANLLGFSLIDVRKTDVHGGSYVFVLKKGDHDQSLAAKRLEHEQSRGLYDTKTYDQYAESCKKVVEDFRVVVERFRNHGFKVIGYGAAAKGNTFLNFADITLDYIVDDNKLKWNLMTPGQNIPIKDPKSLKEEDPSKIVIVPLAWNFFKEIRERANSITNNNLTFIKYFPEVTVL
jgi:2-polyprenyl-3-methyl-5-hydroxy-6-metoxy-1,4-benzoquinol methylase